jgi:hypothetical protein
VLRQRRNVMGDDHPALDRRPLQNSGVVCSGEPDVLDADECRGRVSGGPILEPCRD